MTASGIYGPPPTAAILEAVREFVQDSLLPLTSGSLRYHTLVALRGLEVVEREIAAGQAPVERHRANLEAIGYASDEELAAALRAGEVRADAESVRRVVAELVAAKLAVWDPNYE